MNFRYPHPDNEKSFEKFCLKLLQRHWNNPHLELYGRRGEDQSGVDIIDPTFSTPFRAGQCKHHEPHLTIPPAEIEAEVTRALTFDPPLKHFAIITSGRATTHAQNKIIEINREHRAKGLFIVELIWWEKIEDLLDEYPEVAALLTKITNAHITALDEKITQGLMAVSTQIEGVSAVSGRTARDAEIDEAEGWLKNSDPQRARILLERIRQRHWDELTPQQKYRVKAAFANAALLQGSDQEAGRLLLEAKDVCPDSERAQINEALGLELLGRKSEAHALANQLRDKFPSSGNLLAIYIRTAPGTPSLNELEALLSAATEKDAEVCIALAIRAMGMYQFSEAADYAKTAVVASPDWFGSKFMLGQALYNAESMKLGRGFRPGSDPLARARLVEAISAIDGAIALAKKCHADHLLSQCFLIRALANALRCEDSEAEQDFNEATRTGPENRHAHQRFAMYLVHRNRMDEAIVELRKAVRGSSSPVAESQLADLLSERDKAGDRAEAIEIYARLALADSDLLEETESEYKPKHLDALPIAAFHSAVNEYIDANRLNEAEAFVDRVPADRFNAVSMLTARSQLNDARGDFQGATTAADGALREVEAGTHHLSLRALALQLGKLERHKDALPLWLRITQSAEYSNDVRHIVRCAERVHRYDVILRVAKAAREGGIQDTWLLFKEADVLGMFDLDGAVALLQDRIQKHPGDKDARLLLSQLGLKWHRPDLVDARIEALPSLDEVTATGGAIAVEILREQGDPNEALHYAYELFRRYYENPEANAALVRVLLSPNPRSLQLDKPALAGPGAAVCLEEDEGNKRWVVIEDSPNLRPELDEFGTTHPLSLSLGGKRVGDSVVLSKTSARDRTATVREIKSKYLYRLHEILESWQVRFPNQEFIEMFRATSRDATTGDDEPDLTDIKLVADRHYERTSEAENAYKTQFIPLHLLSQIAGCDPFRAIYYVALRVDLPVRCNEGRQDEHEQALEALGSCNTLVLDLTAVGSILLLRLEDLLTKWRGKFVISQSTAAELKSSLKGVTTRRQGTGHFGKTEQGYFFQQYSEEGMKAEADALASLVETVLRICDVRGCPELAELDPEKREHLIHAFGQHGVESMLLARQPGYAIWSDDFAVGLISASEFSVRRVWTQLVVEYAVTQGLVTPNEYLVVSAKLLGMDYQATTFNPFVTAKAGSMSDWNPEKWPLNKVLEQFVNPTMSPEQLVAFAATMLLAAYKEAPLVETRQTVLIKILERLLLLPDGIVIARTFVSLFPMLFGVNVLAAGEATEIGQAWLAEARWRPTFRISDIRPTWRQET